jgi:hypothetical protein
LQSPSGRFVGTNGVSRCGLFGATDSFPERADAVPGIVANTRDGAPASFFRNPVGYLDRPDPSPASGVAKGSSGLVDILGVYNTADFLLDDLE